MGHAILPLDETARELLRWAEQTRKLNDASDTSSTRVVEALCDDMNTHSAITELRRLYKSGDIAALRSSLDFLGVGLDEQQLQGRKHKRLYGDSASLKITIGSANLSAGFSTQVVDTLIAARLEARKAKNWAESDRIRDELAAMGIAIKDNKDGTTSWEVKR